MLKIGELASRVGISIRTLHHYDELGLLSPSTRTESGYRLYSLRDVKKLQHILLLKQLGFSLQQIIAILGQQSISLLDTFNSHIETLENRIENQKNLLQQLTKIKLRLEHSEQVSIEDYLTIMEMMMMYEKYFTPEQIKQFEKRAIEMGEETLNEVQTKVWPELINRVQQAIDDGLEPESEEVQQMARQWQQLVLQFTQGNPDIANRVGKLYQNEPSMMEKTGLNSEIFKFMTKAQKSLNH